MPFLNIYGMKFLPALRIGEFIVILMLIYIFITSGKIHIDKSSGMYWSTIFYISILSIVLTVFIDTYSIADAIIRIARVFFYTFLALSLSQKYFDYELGKKLYINFSFIASIFVVLQFLILQITGKYITFILPNMNLSTNYANSNQYFNAVKRDLRWYGKTTRPSGVFLEPAHFCEFAILSLIFLLFTEKKDKKNIFLIVFNTFAIAISGSAIGYFGLLVIYFLWVVHQLKEKKIKLNTIIFGIIIMIAALIISARYNLFDKALWRLMTINSKDSSTGNLRLLRGFVIYDKMPFLYKIIGMGIGNFGAFIDKYNIVTFFDSTLSRTNEFMNSLSVILVSGGAFGLLLYIISLFNFYRRADSFQKIFFCIFIVMILTTNNFYKESYMFPLMFMTISNKVKRVKKDDE